jgi:carbonic anhydrase/acetyltransferase-like protein (isoleucine patch superfamily)
MDKCYTYLDNKSLDKRRIKDSRKRIGGKGMANFIASSADVYGDVTIEKGATIWFQSVLRGDSNTIAIGEMSNVQDGTIVHVDHDAPTSIGEYVTIGHACIIHGCTIHSGALIGMGSTILNHAEIGENSLIGAGSLVTEGTVIPPNSLAFGSPARVIRQLTPEEISSNRKNAEHYYELGEKYLNNEIPPFQVRGAVHEGD